MEYRRRRRKQARRQHGSSGAGKFVVVLLAAAAIVYIISASAAGTWIAENVMAPLFTGIEEVLAGDIVSSDDNETSTSGLSNQQVSLVSSSKTKKEEITLPGITCYMLQMGVYSKHDNAVAQAEALRARGAGGYIIIDGDRYRVIASGYDTKTSLESVCEHLKQEGMDSATYEINVPAAVFSVTADETQLSQVRKGFSALKEAQQALAELSVEFDRSQQTPAEGRNAALEILAPLESLQAQLSVQQEQGGVLAEVLGCYASCVSAIRGLSEYESKSIVDFSSKIKYTHLQVTYEYAKLVESLSSTS